MNSLDHHNPQQYWSRFRDFCITAGLLLSVIGFYLIAITENMGRDILNSGAGLLILLGIVQLFQTPWRHQKLLITALAAMAACTLAWYVLFRSGGEFRGHYSSHLRVGKTLLGAAFIIYLVAHSPVRLNPKLLSGLSIGLATLVNLIALYAMIWGEAPRVALEIRHATTCAYILTVFDIFMFSYIMRWQGLWKWLFLPIAFVTAYAAIIATGTRSAMLIFPFVVIALLVLHNTQALRRNLLTVGVMALCSIATLVALSSIAAKRLDAMLWEITEYGSITTESSLGSRVAMLHGGWLAGLSAPLGQSAEQRADIIRRHAAETPSLKAAEPYLDSHMHNELIDTFSERGIVGVLLLLLLYAALLRAALKTTPVNGILLMITLCMIYYGLVDVIFFAYEGYYVYLMAIIFAIAGQPLAHSETSATGT